MHLASKLQNSVLGLHCSSLNNPRIIYSKDIPGDSWELWTTPKQQQVDKLCLSQPIHARSTVINRHLYSMLPQIQTMLTRYMRIGMRPEELTAVVNIAGYNLDWVLLSCQ